MVLSVMVQFFALAMVPAVCGFDVEVVEPEVVEGGVGVGADVEGLLWRRWL